MIKVVIVDDDILIRDGLEIILSVDKEIEVIGKAKDGQEGLILCQKESPDVVLLDIQMPIMNGIECLIQLKNTTKCKVLLLTTFDEDQYIIEALKHRVDGYLLKNSEPERIKMAIKAIHQGNIVLHETVIEKMQIQTKDTILSHYSERENEVIQLISKGMSNKQIASALFISEGTVKNYITTILQKSGLEHRTQIAIHYLKGLL